MKCKTKWQNCPTPTSYITFNPMPDVFFGRGLCFGIGLLVPSHQGGITGLRIKGGKRFHKMRKGKCFHKMRKGKCFHTMRKGEVFPQNEKKKFWVCEAKSSGINRDLGTHTQGQRFSQSRTLFYIEPRGGKLWFLCCWLLVLKAIKNKEEICKVLKESTTTNIGTAYREFLVTNLSKHLTIFRKKIIPDFHGITFKDKSLQDILKHFDRGYDHQFHMNEHYHIFCV